MENQQEVSLGGCYHDGLAYSLGYDAHGDVELVGRTFTNFNTGLNGGAMAALLEHRRQFDPSVDVERFIVALKPVKIIMGREEGESYELTGCDYCGVRNNSVHLSENGDDICSNCLKDDTCDVCQKRCDNCVCPDHIDDCECGGEPPENCTCCLVCDRLEENCICKDDCDCCYDCHDPYCGGECRFDNDDCVCNTEAVLPSLMNAFDRARWLNQ